LPVGPEVITGSTRLTAGTAQQLVLNLLSTPPMIRLGKVYSNLMVDVQITNQKLARRGRGIVAEVLGVSLEEAARLLEASGNRVKLAIVMGALGVSAEEGARLLDQAQGRLASILPG